MIATERLILRRLRAADAETLAALAGSFEVAKWLRAMPHPYGLAQARAYIARTEAETSPTLNLAVTLRAGGLLGMVGLNPADRGGLSLGYWLGEAHWGQGYAFEAAAGLTRFAFEALALDAIVAGYFHGNAASARILARLGFLPLEDVMRPCLARGEAVPGREFILTRARWAEAAINPPRPSSG